MIYLELLLSFLKIGAFTFGGGYAMLPLIMETVISRGWMTEEQLIDFVAVAESTPGPFAVNIATYIGAETAGFLGAVCATLGVALPSFVIILLVAKGYEKFRKSRLVSGAMTGLKPVVVGLIGAAILSIAVKALQLSSFALTPEFGISVLFSLIVLVPAVILAFKKVHPIVIVLISAGLGVGFGYLEELLLNILAV